MMFHLGMLGVPVCTVSYICRLRVILQRGLREGPTRHHFQEADSGYREGGHGYESPNSSFELRRLALVASC